MDKCSHAFTKCNNPKNLPLDQWLVHVKCIVHACNDFACNARERKFHFLAVVVLFVSQCEMRLEFDHWLWHLLVDAECKEESELLREWFNLMRERTELRHYERELMVRAQEMELEDRHARLRQELQERMSRDGERGCFTSSSWSADMFAGSDGCNQ